MSYRISSLRSGAGITALSAGKLNDGTLNADRLPVVSGLTSGTYGSSAAIPILTVDNKGRVTSASTTSLAPTTASTIMRMTILEYTSSAAPVVLGQSGSIPFNSAPVNEMGSALNTTNNTFTLPAGTYMMNASVAIANTQRARILLRNVTDSAVVKYGTTVTGALDGSLSVLNHRFVLTATKTLRMDVESSSTTTTLSYNGSFSAQPESFAQVVIYGIIETVTPMPTQVCFYAYGSSTANTSAAGTIVFDTELQDIGNSYDATTGVFTAPYSGAYSLYFMLFVVQSNLTSDTRASMYWVSGSTTTLVSHVHAGNDYTSLSGSATLVLAAGDRVYLQNEGSGPMTLNLRQGHSYFGGYYIGMQNVPTDGLVSSTGSVPMTGSLTFNRAASTTPALGSAGGAGDRVVLRAGTASVHPYSLGTDSTAMWSSVPSGANFNWYVNGTERMRLASDGTLSLPSSVLATTRTTNDAPAVGTNGGTGDRVILRQGGASVYPYSLGTNSTSLWHSVPTGAAHDFFVNNANRLSIAESSISINGNNNGNVGIGTTSPASSAKLHLAGGNMFIGNSTHYTTSVSVSGAGLLSNMLVFDGIHDASTTGTPANKIRVHNVTGWVAGFGISTTQFNYHSGANHVFYTATTSTSYGDERMRLTNTGRLGIGVTSPTQPLHVSGDARADRFISSTPVFVFATTTTTAFSGWIAPYDSVKVDLSSSYNTTTKKFTAPIDGIYDIHMTAWGVTEAHAGIAYNGDYPDSATYNGMQLWQTNTAGHAQGSWTLKLNATDTIRAVVYNSGSLVTNRTYLMISLKYGT